MPVKRRSTSYTSMTLKRLRENGAMVEKVESFNRFAGPHGVRRDAFGFMDLLVIDPAKGIVAIQCTGPNGLSDHRQKLLVNEFVPEWLKAGGKVELWSWRKLLTKRGGKARRWFPRIEVFTLNENGELDYEVQQ